MPGGNKIYLSGLIIVNNKAQNKQKAAAAEMSNY